ncbi:MAG: DNA polymerase IV [Ethanoligenens sp.]
MKLVFLVDMNAFFISCETVRDPTLAVVPAAVAGDPERRSGIILTANYAARASGVKTTMTIYQAKALCPTLRLVPPDHAYYAACSYAVMRILARYTPIVEQNSIDEAWLDLAGCLPASTEPVALAKQIMAAIKQETGLDCSIGIAENKFLAKMAADMKKPRGITTLWPAEIGNKLWPLPVGDMYGVGRKMREKLIDRGITTIGDLVRCGEQTLAARYGKWGAELYAHARGYDPSSVTPHQKDEMKSIGRSTTLASDVTDFEQADKVLLALSESVGERARRHHKKGTTVHLTIKYADFSVVTRQTTLPATDMPMQIYMAACNLLRKHWNGRAVRLLGISLSGFAETGNRQLTFADMLGAPSSPSKQDERLEAAVGRIRAKYGNQKILRAALLEKKQKSTPF